MTKTRRLTESRSELTDDRRTPTKDRPAPLVLVAEDDPALRELVASALRRDAYEVEEARNGVELVEQLGTLWLEQRIPALIIADVRMPRLGGLDVLAGLRRPEGTIPFLVITAFGSREMRQEARVLGAAAVLDKPFRMSTLRSMVADLTGKVRT